MNRAVGSGSSGGGASPAGDDGDLQTKSGSGFASAGTPAEMLAALGVPRWYKFAITYQSTLGAGVVLMPVTAGMILEDWFLIPATLFDDGGSLDLALYVGADKWETFVNSGTTVDLSAAADNVSTSISRAANSVVRQASLKANSARISTRVITGGNLIAMVDGFVGNGTQGAADIYVKIAGAPT